MLYNNTGVTIGFSPTSYIVFENDTVVEVCVNITGGRLAADRVVTFEVESMSGTATGEQTDHSIYTREHSYLQISLLTAEDDYVPFKRIFTLTYMKILECFDVQIKKDNIFDPDETFMVLLKSSDSSATLERTSAVITIDDILGMPFSYYYLSFLDYCFIAFLSVVCFNAHTFKPKSVFQEGSFRQLYHITIEAMYGKQHAISMFLKCFL